MRITAHDLVTCWWFDIQAEEAVNFSVSIFENSRVGGSAAMAWSRRRWQVSGFCPVHLGRDLSDSSSRAVGSETGDNP